MVIQPDHKRSRSEADFLDAAKRIYYGDGTPRNTDGEVLLAIQRALLTAYCDGYRNGERSMRRSALRVVASLLRHVERVVTQTIMEAEKAEQDLERDGW